MANVGASRFGGRTPGPLFVLGGARLATDQLGSYVLAEPPDHHVCAIQVGPVANGEQYEFVRNVESKSIDPHAAIGEIGNQAGERRIALTELDFRKAVAGVARRAASFVGLGR